jgi:hypothetical protein
MPLNVGAVVGELALTNSWSATLEQAAADQQQFESKATSGFAGVGASAETSGVKLGGAATQMTGLGEATDTTSTRVGSFATVTKSLDIEGLIANPAGAAKGAMVGLAESMGGVAVVAVGAVTGVVAIGTAMFELASRAAAVGAGLDDMADKTGLSVPALSRLSNAAQVIGADMGTLTDVVFKLQRGLGENTDAFQAGLAKMGLSTAELKAAGPDRYLELVTAGLKGIVDPTERAAAGNAVLGRGYKDVAAALNDLDDGFKATADLTPWTAEQAKRAEEFEQQIASLEVHIKAAGIAVGNDLIPAVSLLVTVLEGAGTGTAALVGHINQVFNQTTVLTQALQQYSAETAVSAALQQTMNSLWRDAALRGLSLAEAGDDIAKTMLTLGVEQQVVAEQTGLTVDAVKRLAIELNTAKAVAEEYTAVWGRLDALEAAGVPTIDGLSASTKGLVAHYVALGASVADITAATGVSAKQQALLTTAHADGEAAAKKYAGAWEELNSIGVSWKATVAEMSPVIVEQIQHYLAAGASQATLAEAYGKSTLQIKAIADGMKDYGETLKKVQALEADKNAAATAGLLGLSKLEQETSQKRFEAEARGIDQIQKADAELHDILMKSKLDDTSYRINKIWEEADAQIKAFKGTADQAQAYAERVIAIASDQASKIEYLADAAIENTTQTGIDAMTKLVAANAAAIAAMRGAASAAGGGTGRYDAQGTDTWGTGRYDAEGKDTWGVQAGGMGGIVTYGGQSPSTSHPSMMAVVLPRATGGPVTAGQSYLVGDRADKQPEIFTPGASGFITPQSGGSGVAAGAIVINLYGTPAELIEKVKAVVTRQILQGAKV